MKAKLLELIAHIQSKPNDFSFEERTGSAYSIRFCSKDESREYSDWLTLNEAVVWLRGWIAANYDFDFRTGN